VAEGPEFRAHALRLPPESAGLRFDQALARSLPQYSRARLKDWIETGAVQVDGRPLRAKDKVLGGEQVRIQAELPVEVTVAAEALPLEVLFKDRALLIINKPAGLVVHPGAGNARHTLQNALLGLDPSLARVPRAGLVHRLDKDTSGLLVVARTPEAHTALVAAMASREITREYLAVCTGVMTGGGTIDEPIGRHRTQRTRMAVRADGRPSVTHYRVVSASAATPCCACSWRPAARTDPRAPGARRIPGGRGSGLWGSPPPGRQLHATSGAAAARFQPSGAACGAPETYPPVHGARAGVGGAGACGHEGAAGCGCRAPR
jgi:RluA family pseudouridine synthase